ncbi:MAG: bile acid:sodium symporter, partial [Halobacteriales archaeon]|nr:bile acid:sodium symporter [Halobacteriales archaeon]
MAALTITYVAVPVAGISLARHLLSGDPLVAVAVRLSVPATAGSAIVYTRRSHGNAELSGLASAGTIVLAPLLTPYVLAHLVDKPVDLPKARIEFELLVILVASLVLLWAVPNRLLGEG